MVNTTKEKIAYTFLSLVKKKSLQKISVSEIVEAAGISRGTFLIHLQFQEIPAIKGGDLFFFECVKIHLSVKKKAHELINRGKVDHAFPVPDTYRHLILKTI